MSYGSTQDLSILANNRLLRTRKYNNHSRDDVTSLIGLHRNTIMSIELNRYKFLYQTTIEKLEWYFRMFEEKN